MKAQRNQISFAVPIAMALSALSILSTGAQAQEASRWQLKASIASVDTSDRVSINKPSGGEIQAGGDVEVGAAIAIEYRWTDLIGFELGAVFTKTPDLNDTVSGDSTEIGEGPSFVPLLAGVNFHLLRSEQFDVYVGPRIAFVNFGDFSLDIDGQSTKYEVDDEFAWGATVGMNYQFGDSRWALVAEATYLDVDMKISERGTNNSVTSGFDPLIVNLGVSYRF